MALCSVGMGDRSTGQVCLSTRAALTKYHTGTLPQPWGRKSEIWAAPGGSRDNLPHAALALRASRGSQPSGRPWAVTTSLQSLPLWTHGTSPVCVSKGPSSKDNSHWI